MTKAQKTKFIEILKEANKQGRLTDDFKKKVLNTLSLRKNTKITNVTKEVVIDLKEVANELSELKKINREAVGFLKDASMGLEIKNLPVFDQEKVTEVIQGVKEETSLLREDLIKADHTRAVERKKEMGDMGVVLTTLFSGLFTFLSRLVKVTTFKTQPTKESFLTPQYVVLYDPHTKSAASLKGLGGSQGKYSVAVPGSMGLKNRAGTNINPATEETLQDVLVALGGTTTNTPGDGSRTITTAGTRVQLSASSVPCIKVIIQAHENNTGTVVVGSSSCVAALVGRRGVALFPTQSQVFEVSNLNSLYIDSTMDGDIVNYYYEVSA